MASKKSPRLGAPGLTKLPGQLALRYRPGQENRLRDAIGRFGSIEAQPASRLLILHCSPSEARAVKSALPHLSEDGILEFATPVMRDRESNLRRVLTDEITLRLKPGHPGRTLAELKAQHGIEIDRRNEFEPTQYVVKVPQTSGTQTLDIARSIDQRADVEFASPNFLTDIAKQ